jgi:hypothetical protein
VDDQLLLQSGRNHGISLEIMEPPPRRLGINTIGLLDPMHETLLEMENLVREEPMKR